MIAISKNGGGPGRILWAHPWSQFTAPTPRHQARSKAMMEPAITRPHSVPFTNQFATAPGCPTDRPISVAIYRASRGATTAFPGAMGTLAMGTLAMGFRIDRTTIGG